MTLRLPEVALTPDHAPEAAQLVASVEVQVRVDAAPVLTLMGLALMESVAAWATLHSAMTGSAAIRKRANKFFLRELEIVFVTILFLKFIGARLCRESIARCACSLLNHVEILFFIHLRLRPFDCADVNCALCPFESTDRRCRV